MKTLNTEGVMENIVNINIYIYELYINKIKIMLILIKSKIYLLYFE